jgi:uncharacterized protein (TIGR02588 family)
MKKLAMKIIVVIAVVGLVSLTGCLEQLINPTKFVVTNQNSREVGEGIAKMYYVDVTVRNDGGSGVQKVQVKVTQEGNHWSQEDVVELGSGESTSLTFNVEVNSGIPWTYEVFILEA